jgi:hypothetical protein
LDGFSSNYMLQMTTRYMGYTLYLHSPRAGARARVCERARD